MAASLTYETLNRRAIAIAGRLQRELAPGERVLLLYLPGADFIVAFLACLYAGILAIPANPPRAHQSAGRLKAIIADAGARAILGTTSVLDQAARRIGEFVDAPSITLIATDTVPDEIAASFSPVALALDSLAFLQYTSGSTGAPKGVIVSHGNLVANLECIRSSFQLHRDSICATWLPCFHDMGLVGTTLELLYLGATTIQMSPTAFLKRPIRWLRAISQYRATVAGAPNFAYDLCISSVGAEERDALDLSSWTVAFCGAEPIHRDTLERFTEHFRPAGFRSNAFYPCFGQAEATLIITGGQAHTEPACLSVGADALQRGMIARAAPAATSNVRHLVGCGRPWHDTQLIIVDPERLTRAAPSQIGEIWISGSIVARGYWNQPEHTEETFRARLSDTGEGPFLRTGDLGVYLDHQLYITGRRKDILIVRGLNHYPQDIEFTAERSDPALRMNGSAAFGVEIDGEERLVVLQEVERTAVRDLDAAALAGRIRQAIVDEHGLDVHAIVFLKAGAVLKTSSGKIQRHACRAAFLAGELPHVVGEWRKDREPLRAPAAKPIAPPATPAANAREDTLTPEVIEQWLIARLAQQLQLDPADLDVLEPFARYGLDSVAAVRLSAELEKHLGVKPSVTALYNHPSIRQLSAHLATLAGPADTAGSSAVAIDYSRESIAIIGMSCRFPGAPDVESFRRVLRDGVDAITEVPPFRWDRDAFYHPGVPTVGKMTTKWGGFLPDIDRFDPLFFNILPVEAEQMDPQQRLVLMVAWEALERAGVVPSRLAGSATGVFIGISTHEYSRILPLHAADLSRYAGTGNSFAVAANRLSYYLDVRGPSWAVDTACSSSLVAVHNACQSLRSGETDLCLAGGVNALFAPETTVILSQAGMMAPDGRCKTFDASADGYVRSEGCGVVVLKRLADAERDGDRILAVIRGSAVNQDGRSNGLTAPNGQAQQAVIRKALENAGVPAARIGCVEAHGTGTSLGDPIEVDALRQVLQDGRPPERKFWLGAVKANLGHLESAAGMAGLIKAVLTLHHGEITPQIHVKKLNPNLISGGKPFEIADRIHPWTAPPHERFMGVSSFGFGGTNAHVVLAGYPAPEPPRASPPAGPELIVLSARTDLQLAAAARRLADHLDGDPASPPLSVLAANLRLRREAMAHRLALVVETIPALVEKLRRFAAGDANIERLHRGNTQAERARARQWTQADRAASSATPVIKTLFRQGAWDDLAERWVCGVTIDWHALPSGPPPAWIDLPTYPFALERHWLPISPVRYAAAAPPRDELAGKLHPLLDRNSSTFDGIEFSTRLLGDEFFLDDHRVQDRRVVPAAAYLEMARAAGELAQGRTVRALKNLVWTRPLAMLGDEPLDLQVRLRPGEATTEFAVDGVGAGGEPPTRAEGHLVFSSDGDARAEAPPLDLAAIRARCTERRSSAECYGLFRSIGLQYGVRLQGIVEVAGSATEALARLRLPAALHEGQHHYTIHPTLLDSAFQAVIGISGSAAAGLSLPFALDELELLRPVPRDVWVHVTTVTMPTRTSGIRKFELRIADDEGQVLIRVRNLALRSLQAKAPEQPAAAPAAAPVAAIQPPRATPRTGADAAGPRSTGPISAAPPSAANPPLRQPGKSLHYYSPCWAPRRPPAPASLAGLQPTLLFDRDRTRFDRLKQRFLEEAPGRAFPVLLVLPGSATRPITDEVYQVDPAALEGHRELVALLKTRGVAVSGILHLWCHDQPLYPVEDHADWQDRLRRQLEWGIHSIFHLSKALVGYSAGPKIHVCCAVDNPSGRPLPHHAALSGLCKTIHQEYPKLAFKLIEHDGAAPDILDRAMAELQAEPEAVCPYVRYDASGCWERRTEDADVSTAARAVNGHGTSVLRSRGVYLITGGAGGLGLTFARHLAETVEARLILVGRSPLSDAIRHQLSEIGRLGGEAIYVQADVCDPAQMLAAVAHARERFPAIHGVLHSAGLLRDRMFFHKPSEEFASVLAPKIQGTLALDAATRSEPLDFFVLFSSIVCVEGNRGQTDYATGNAFLDAFAGLRDHLTARGLRHGRTLSINWPLWREGGMSLSEEILAEVSRSTGILPLETHDGLHAFHVALQSGRSRLMVIDGDKARIDRSFYVDRSLARPELATAALPPAPREVPPAVTTEAVAGDEEALAAQTLDYLISTLSQALKLPPAAIEPARPFTEYGIDSMMALQLIKTLEKTFGPLPKTLLFENFDVRDLTRYFVTEHAQTLRTKFQLSPGTRPARRNAGDASPPVRPVEGPAPNRTATVIRESELSRHPGLHRQVDALLRRHGLESVALARRDIAPLVFLASDGASFIYIHRSDAVLLATGYVGPETALPHLVRELADYCQAHSLQLNILSEAALGQVSGLSFTATPFGALQRLRDLQSFHLEGKAMQRLRYQVRKFESAGAPRTVEYRAGSDAPTDLEIADLIDRWCSTKTMINPYVHRVKRELAAGALGPAHRLFLTWLDDRLQNVIVISKMPSTDGYLMDVEFYPPEMPLGGLEFGITRILETLIREGCTSFSLGATHGVRIGTSPNSDPGVEAVLDSIQSRGIFDGRGNFQFKNKFRPDNTPYFLCRLNGAEPATVTDLILMIAQPERLDPAPTATEVRTGGVESERRSDHVANRRAALARAGYNPIHLSPDEVEIDLITDSWAQLEMPAIHARLGALGARLAEAIPVEDSLREVFPFAHVAAVASGRQAEWLLCDAWPRRTGLVPQNLLFPTFIYHQIDHSLTPHEIPVPEVFDLSSSQRFKGNVDSRRLEQALSANAGGVAFVCVELCSNASGGHPISLANLREVRAICSRHGAQLILDLTRVVENACFLGEYEEDCAGRSVWDVVKEICALADGATASLSKDFCINTGGFVATNNLPLWRRIEESVTSRGSGLSTIDKKLIALALRDRAHIEAQVRERMRNVETLFRTLARADLPVARPTGGHCILVDVPQLPALAGFAHPLASFLAFLYDETGIRAGIHNGGARTDTPLGRTVRLAIPVGLEPHRIEEIAARLARLPEALGRIIPLAPVEQTAGPLGAAHARFLPASVQEPHPAVSAVTITPPEDPIARWEAQVYAREARDIEIAIIGMAGRYPMADSVWDFWSNLAGGRDCISQSPLYRWTDGERRLPLDRESDLRWGGFVNDADKFDSLFFNISPREAEVLDPQERLFLEVAWEAFEDAGYVPDALAAGGQTRNVGVFVGAVWALYQIAGAEAALAGDVQTPNSFLWSIANRVSYVMNLHGPSMAVDTACSASLTAVHLACEAIRRKECQLALVGGVNLDLHPIKQLISEAGGVLSKDGRCRAFGRGANGYVPGEGVGALVLKPLHRALRDGDNIHGIVKGTVVNHGGRASGYVVPNPNAQAELIATAVRRSGIDGATIGYIETHGTGTQLGDPIELTGLTSAFRQFTDENQICAIGSVKTNIGHLEAAAGVAGLTKVLLQMRNRQLVPSLHSAEHNEFLDLEHSPFHVQQTLSEWRPAVIDGMALPLRAGISSFGAGGANAHVIIEQHVANGPHDARGSSQGDREIIALSARSEEQLRAYAERMERFLGRDGSTSLRDIAYTLQVGRKPLEVRLALLVSSRTELIDGLAAFRRGDKPNETMMWGDTRNHRAVTAIFHAKETEELVRGVARKGQLLRLAQLWVHGVLNDWQEHAGERKGRRVSLPTYPFARQRHWVPVAPLAAGRARTGATLHPLLDSNESTFEQQLYCKVIDPGQFVFRDHIVAGIPTLPGVAYLEMARAAGELSAHRAVGRLKNLVWATPININSPSNISIHLVPHHDQVEYEVTTGSNGDRRIHAQGKLVYAASGDAPAEDTIDLQAIRDRCREFKSRDLLYDLLGQCHLTYGPCLQAISGLYHNDEEGLTLLELPAPLKAGFGSFGIHPSLMDGAVQSIIGLLLDADVERHTPYLPFVLGEVAIHRPLVERCYAHLRLKPGKQKSMKKLDVDLVDEAGRVLVAMRDFSLKALSLEGMEGPEPGAPRPTRLYYRNVWAQS